MRSFFTVWLAAASAAGACASSPTPVILISVDTLRADHLSAYGYHRIRTPNLDSFGQLGTLFTDAACQIPLTLPSHTSMFTSTYPFENRIEENEERVPPGAVTLASVLRSHGYKTAAFAGSILLDRRMGLDQGFDFYDSPFDAPFDARPGVLQNPYSVRVRRDGALVARAALQWLNANRGQPVFVFIHLFDLHTPYSLPAASAGKSGISGYDAAIEYVDGVAGRLRKGLEAGGWWDRSLVVLLSDHGESLGDHGENSHGYFVYQSTLHVPLMFHWPSGAASYPARDTQPAGLIDVAPTILDFLHLPAPPSFEGESLLHAGEHAVYSESVYTRDAFHWAALRAVRVGAYKYIEAPKPELYNLQDDPREQANLFRKNPAEAQALRSRLAKALARYAPKQPAPSGVSKETSALLGSLGYLSGGSRPDLGDSGPDPKDKLSEYRLFEKALTALYSNGAGAAIVTFRQLLARDPHNTMARYYLGESYLRAGKPDDAIREWRAALAQDPKYAAAAEAISEVSQAACKIAPDSARCRGQ